MGATHSTVCFHGVHFFVGSTLHLCRCSLAHFTFNDHGVLLSSEFVDHLDEFLIFGGHSLV
jgi:hypothetical protein